ncbi:MAG: thioredoxin family protein [Candidatus Micrarchaeota archaeon]|nr:thioredoxin family protein [Candidatus Micrarchaeota archaeon]
MNPFLKAGILTVVVVAMALLVVAQLDSLRTQELRTSIDSVVFENQARDVLQHYGRVMANDTATQCKYLAQVRQKQFDTTYPLALRIQDYEKNNLLGSEYESLKTEYYLGTADIYISGFEQKETCGGNEVPLLMFYTEKTQCPDCRAQNLILPDIATRCSNVRILALPSDYNLTPLEVLADRYNISTVPAIVINDSQKLVGLTSEDDLVKALRAQGANCS